MSQHIPVWNWEVSPAFVLISGPAEQTSEEARKASEHEPLCQ